MPKDRETGPDYSRTSGAFEPSLLLVSALSNLLLGYQCVSRMGSERLPPSHPSTIHGLCSLR